LHTNDAPGAIMRLMDMGIEPFLINAALSGVLAQRLARKICPHCKVSKKPTEWDKKILQKLRANLSLQNASPNLELKELYYGAGCQECFNLGYKGRVGIFELLTVCAYLRALIIAQPKFDAIHAQSIASGMRPMAADGLSKVKQGIVSLDELIRVIW